jgi:integrase
MSSSKKTEERSAVSLKASNGALQLVFTHPTERNAKGHRKQKYISTGLPDTAANRRAVKAGLAAEIERNLGLGTIDAWLAAREAKKQEAIEVSPVTLKVTLTELWKRYTDWAVKAKGISESTKQRDYGKIEKRLTKMPTKLDCPDKGIEIRDYLLDAFSSEVTRRTLVQLNACCNWAYKSGLIESNTFEGLSKDIKKTTRNTSRKAFSVAEQDVIIEAFESNRFCDKFSPTLHSFYTNWVRLLFMTGARPEELAALTWGKIDDEYKTVLIDCALPSDTGIEGQTKTKASKRVFRCYASLEALLRAMHDEAKLRGRGGKDDKLISGAKGARFDSHNFSNRVWQTVVKGLVKEGKVKQYLPQYNCRHTLMTLLMDAGVGAKDIAIQLGTSPEIIYKHYGEPKDEAFVDVYSARAQILKALPERE